MPKIIVTGATGHFGSLVIESLLSRGVSPADIRASVHDIKKADFLREKGIDVRRGDYDDADSLKKAFEGGERILIISGVNVGQRIDQHRRAIQAASQAGAKLIAYTSAVDMGKGDAANPIAIDHRATEKMLRESGTAYTIMRNTYYAEYMLAPVVQAQDKGVFVSSVGNGKLGAAARPDLAEAAAVVLLSNSGHANMSYELTYPRAWDYAEATRIVSQASGKPLEYKAVSDEEMERVLREAGTPAPSVAMTVGMNRSLRNGDLSKISGDLETLLGRPVTKLEEVVRRLINSSGR